MITLDSCSKNIDETVVHKLMRDDWKRENLKHNFLKHIVVRFDYTGVAEVELDRIIAKVKPIFKESGYDNLKEEYLTELDFQFQDPESMEMEGLPVKDIRRKRAYVFHNEEKGIRCKLSTQCAFVSIQNTRYIGFFEYSRTLMDVIKVLIDEVEFLDCVRFGIRKINQCIIRDINSLHTYFDTKLFQIYGLDKRNVPKLFESKDCFAEGSYNFNLIRMVVSGEYEGSPAYQVVLDSDIYITDADSMNQLFCNDSQIAEMNERLFKLYREALTESFLKELSKENFRDTNIIGVERNE